jgi:hypothetical protein
MPLSFPLPSRIRNRLDATPRPARILEAAQPSTAAASNPDIVGSTQPGSGVTYSGGTVSPAVLQVPVSRSLSVTSTQTALPAYSEIAAEESGRLTGPERLETAEAVIEELCADAHSRQPMVDPTLCTNGRIYDTLTLRRLAAANGGVLTCPETNQAIGILGPVENIRLLSHALHPHCAVEYVQRRRLQEVVGSPSAGGTASPGYVNAPASPSSLPPAYSRLPGPAQTGRVHTREVPNSPPPRYRSLDGDASTPASVGVAGQAARAGAATRRPARAVPASEMTTPPLRSRHAAVAPLPLPALPEPVRFACGNLSLQTACAALKFQRQGSQGSVHYTQQRLRMDLFYSVGLVASLQASVDIALALQNAGLFNVRFTDMRNIPLRRETVLAALGVGSTPNPDLTPEACTLAVAHNVADLVFILRQEDTRVLALGNARQATQTLLQEARSQVPRNNANVACLKQHIRDIDDARQDLPDSVSPTANEALPLVP